MKIKEFDELNEAGRIEVAITGISVLVLRSKPNI